MLDDSREEDPRRVGARYSAISALGAALAGQKKYAEGERLLIQGFEGISARADKIPSGGRINLVDAGNRVVELYEAWGKPEKAAEWRKRLQVGSATVEKGSTSH